MLAANLRERYTATAHVTVVEADVLTVNLSEAAGGLPFKLVGNVPYYITTPILFHALAAPRPERAVYLVQREVADRVVGGLEHPVDVDQLEEDHQADGEHGVVGGADVGDVVVHLVGHEPELVEDQPLGDLLGALLAPFRRVPDESVQPLAGPGHEQRRAVFDAALNGVRPLLLRVDDDGLLGRHLEHLLAGDLLVDAGIERDLGRAGEVLLAAVADLSALNPGCIPLFVAAIAWAFAGEAIPLPRRVGLALILTGAVILLAANATDAGQSWSAPRAFGAMLSLTAAFMWAVFTVVMRRADLDPLHAAALVSTGSLVIYLPFYFAWRGATLAQVPLAELAIQIVSKACW